MQRNVIRSFDFNGESMVLVIGTQRRGLSMFCVAKIFFCFHDYDKYRYISPECRRKSGNRRKEQNHNIQLSSLPKDAMKEFQI